MLEIVATNIFASRPPEQQPTTTPIARANRSELNQKRIVHVISEGNFLGVLPPEMIMKAMMYSPTVSAEGVEHEKSSTVSASRISVEFFCLQTYLVKKQFFIHQILSKMHYYDI